MKDRNQIFRPADDPSTAVLLIEWDTQENARSHLGSQVLRQIYEAFRIPEATELATLRQCERWMLSAYPPGFYRPVA